MHKRIFISHAVKDKPLADAVVDLLQTGANISSNDIFCSSLEGLGIPSGENFIEHIKSQLKEPDTVICILSPNYYESHFCLCELGATWAMSHNLLPLIVAPLTFSNIQGVLTGIQINQISNSDDLNQFVTALNECLGSKKFNFARWEVKKKTFLKNLPNTLKKLPKPLTITIDKFEEIESHYEQSQETLSESVEEISNLELKIKKLKKCKDAKQIKEIEKEFSDEQERFDDLIKDIQTQLEALPRVVTYFLYKSYADQDEVKINGYEDKDLLNEAEKATEEGYLEHDEGFFSLNTDDPKVKKADKSVDELQYYIENELKSEFVENFKEENEYLLSIDNKRFWRDYLNTSYCYL